MTTTPTKNTTKQQERSKIISDEWPKIFLEQLTAFTSTPLPTMKPEGRGDGENDEQEGMDFGKGGHAEEEDEEIDSPELRPKHLQLTPKSQNPQGEDEEDEEHEQDDEMYCS